MSDTARVVFFDLETTGLNTYHDCIIEYGAVDSAGRKFGCIVAPTKPVPPVVVRLTGLTPDFLQAEGASPRDAAAAFIRFLNLDADATTNAQPLFMCAHNAEFDMQMLLSEFRRCDLELPLNIHVLDSCAAFRAQYPEAARSRLADMATEVLGKRQLLQAHRACNDAEVVRDCVMKMSNGDVPQLFRQMQFAGWRRLCVSH